MLITSKLNFEENGSPVGGSVVDLHLKAKGLTELGHTVSVVTAFSNEDHLHGALPYRVFERCIKKRGLLGLQFGVYSILREFESNADAFYLDGHMFLYGAGAYRLFGGGVPVVGFFNIRLNVWADTGGNVLCPSLYRRAKKKVRFFVERILGVPIANHLDAFIFNTPHVQKLYYDFGAGIGKKNVVIQDFVATRELTRTYGISMETIEKQQRTAPPLILFATGRMIPEKGFDLIIRALASLAHKENYRLILSGGGPDKERLEGLALKLGLGKLVEFPGWVPRTRLYEFLTRVHVFIFPKWWIEYGSALLTEVMAFGLPSIIPGGGALEWLTDGSALTFPDAQVGDLAKCIVDLQKDYVLRMRLGTRILARARDLDYLKLSKRLEEVLVSVAT